ncbi:hypothetical protein [Kineosporia sp. A_224]|uniref:hypothetical protein n=1 Tax=Kineosporia sp. A_224 TaxID=1962180 RepID=UPI000B4B267F|nr:hypothetical protein [Kineosporia sp. A_224]
MTTDPYPTDPATDPAARPAADETAGALLGAALGTLVRDEPPMRFTVEDVERRGRLLQRRRRRTRVGLGAGVLVAASGAAFLSAGAPGWQGAQRTPGVALGPTATPSQTTGTGDPNGTSLPVGFPLNEAFVAVQGALPDGVRLGDLPPDVAWEPGGPGYVAAVRVPLARGNAVPRHGGATLRLGPRCALDGADAVLDDVQARAVADAVCEVWTTWGRPDPLAVPPAPSTPPDPAA